MPPNVIANSPTTPMSDQWPSQPAWIRETIIVATEKPARPSADGAAIGWRNTRGRAKPSRHASWSRSATPAEAFSLRSSIVVIRRLLDLPVLRGRLRPVDLRQGRRGHPHRGRSGKPGFTRAPLPEGPGLEELRAQPAARVQGQVPPAVLHAVGGALARRRDGHDR